MNIYDTEDYWKKVRQIATKTVYEDKLKKSLDKEEYKKEQTEIKSNIKHQVDNYIRDIKNPCSEWHKLYGKMSEMQLGIQIAGYILKEYPNRKDRSNVDKFGLKYSVISIPGTPMDLFATKESCELKKRIEKYEQYFPKDKHLSPLAYRSYFAGILKDQRLEQILYAAICINKEIMTNKRQEIEIARKMGLDIIQCGDEIDYIKLSEIMFSEILFKRIGADENPLVRMEYICQYLSNLSVPEIKIEKWKRITLNEKGESINAYGDVFAAVLRLKSLWDEEFEIEKILVEDIQKNPDKLVQKKVPLYPRIKDYKNNIILLTIAVSGKEKPQKRDIKKCEDSKNFIKKWDNIYADEFTEEEKLDKESIFTLSRVYKEIFCDDIKYSERGVTARTIAIKTIQGYKPSSQERVFVEKKLQRGIFSITGNAEIYVSYIDIMQKYRAYLLSLLQKCDEMQLYENLFEVNNKLFDIMK